MDGEKKDLHSLSKVDWLFEAVPLTRTICSTCHSAGTGKAGGSLSNGNRPGLGGHNGIDRW